MKYKRAVSKQGGSFIVAIPKFMADELQIKQADKINFELSGKKIIITKE